MSPKPSRREFIALAAMGSASTLMPMKSHAAGDMLSRAVPKTGERIPVIGLGTYQVFDVSGESAEKEGLAVLREFYAEGGRLIDSSPMYGAAEGVVGELAVRAGINGDLFFATKVWTSGKDAGARQMQRSLELLRRQKLDLMQVHNLLDIETHISTLREWRAGGKLRYIGASHYVESAHAELERAMRQYKLDFIQVNLSVVERSAEDRLLPAAADAGVGVIINRPFAQGGFFDRVRGKSLPPVAKDLACASWAQLALKYIAGHPAVTVVIPATRKLEHLRDNMAAGTAPMPTPKQRQQIAAAFDAL
jgi:diketogulonate reductase-like aldo/keto reductase